MGITRRYPRFVMIVFGLLTGVAGFALQRPSDKQIAQPPAEKMIGQWRSTYVLGPDDVVNIRVLDAEEITDKPVRISSTGQISLPMIGRLQAAGLTVEQLEAELVTQLKAYFKEPEVAVSMAEFRSQPVSVIGAVGNAGVLQLQGSKTLVEILSMAGGLRADAGYSIRITRK